MAKVHACGSRPCWIVTTLVALVLAIAGIAVFASIEKGCVEWTPESNQLLISLGAKTPQQIDAQCELEEASPSSCTRTSASGGVCEMDNSGTDEAYNVIPDCFKTGCSNFPVPDGNLSTLQEDERVCDFLQTNKDTCAGVCTLYEDKVAVTKAHEDCQRSKQFPNRCCEASCTEKACKDDNDKRGQDVLTGIFLIVIGILFGSIFSCGICPVCCYAKEAPTPPAVPVAQASVVLASSAPSKQV